jgi:hypothetical protein
MTRRLQIRPLEDKEHIESYGKPPKLVKQRFINAKKNNFNG